MRKSMAYKDRRDYVGSKVLEQKCQRNGINKAEVLNVFPPIESAYIQAESIKPFVQYTLSKQMQQRQQTTFTNASTWFKTFDRMKNLNIGHDEKTVLSMVNYLILTESIYRFVVDQLCCVFVATGAPHPFKPENAKDCEKLSKNESLANKCKFLMNMNLGKIGSIYNRHIRNAAGHLSFEIKGKGPYIASLKKTIDPVKEYEALWNAAMVGREAIAHYYELYHGPYSHFSDSIFTTDAGIVVVERTIPKMTKAVPPLWPYIARKAEEEFKRA